MVFMEKIVLTILLIGIAGIVSSQKEQPLVLKGNELYKKQQFEKAAEEYEKATALNGKNPKAHLNLGNAYYKSKKTEEAQRAYESAAENSKDVRIKSKALYNEGVTLSRQNKLGESIDAYKKTLRLNPADEQARQNLQKALNELKKEPPPEQKENKKNQDKKNQDKKQPQEPKNNSKLNKKQVEQMLNALRQEEKRLQQNIQKRNNVGGSNGKDW